MAAALWRGIYLLLPCLRFARARRYYPHQAALRA